MTTSMDRMVFRWRFMFEGGVNDVFLQYQLMVVVFNGLVGGAWYQHVFRMFAI